MLIKQRRHWSQCPCTCARCNSTPNCGPKWQNHAFWLYPENCLQPAGCAVGVHDVGIARLWLVYMSSQLHVQSGARATGEGASQMHPLCTAHHPALVPGRHWRLLLLLLLLL